MKAKTKSGSFLTKRCGSITQTSTFLRRLLNYYSIILKKGFGEAAPEGLPTQYPLISQQLHDNGYNNSVLGKWHVGFCRWLINVLIQGVSKIITSEYIKQLILKVLWVALSMQ